MTYKRKRHEGAISCLKKMSYPKNLLFFDTETYNKYNTNLSSKQSLKVGVARYIELGKELNIKKDIEHVFYTNDEFIDILNQYTKSGRKLTVYAHNIAFDIMVLNLPMKLITNGYTVPPPIINGMVFMWKVKKERKTIEFINTGNYVAKKLSKIGDDIGIPKLDINFNNTDLDSLITYCKNDVNIIKEFIIRYIHFIIDNNLGEVKNTLASQAFTTYRHRFMSHDIHVHNDKEVLVLERKAYKGGRTEAFKIGDFNTINYHYVDINSMYPYAMINDKLPVRLLNKMHSPSIDFTTKLLKPFYIIADCTVEIDKPYIGIRYDNDTYNLPSGDLKHSTGKLLFPIGTFRVQLHHDELKHALSYGHIKEIHFMAVYQKEKIFDEYVNYFMDIKIRSKENGNTTDELMAKLLLNSLYGKFGQSFKEMKLIAENVPLDNGTIELFNGHTGIHYQDFVWYGNLYRNFSEGESYYSCPSIAGAITARSRMLMWEYIETIGFEDIYYTDTDSLFTNDKGLNAISDRLHKSKLGYMKLEKTSNHLTIKGCKNYSFHDERKTKGVPKHAYWLNEDCAIYDGFEGFKQWLNRGGNDEPIISKMTKFNDKVYDKGLLDENTGIVTPYVLS